MDRGRLHDVMTVAQVATYLQINKLTVYKYIREGRLPAVRLGRAFRVRQEDVERFLDAHRVPSAPRARPSAAAGSRPRQPRAPAPAAEAQQAEIQVGPQREEQPPPRDTIVTGSPIDWAIRGLH